MRAWAAGRAVRIRAEAALGEARRGAPIERMRFALGTDHDLSDFQRRFRWDPLIGPVIRRRPWIRPRRRPEPVRGARLGGLRAADRVRPRRGDPAPRSCAATAAGAPAGRCSRRPRPPGWPDARRRSSTPAGSRRSARSRWCAWRARWRRGEPTCPSTSPPGAGCAPSRTSATGRSRCWPWPGQGRDDQLPALDVAYLKFVGLAAGLGRRATEDEVREFFAPYGEYAALAGCYALQRRFAR